MRTTWRNSLLLLLACSGAAAQVQTGLIRGTLLNDEGSPVANADVFAMFYLHCDLSNKATRAKIESGHQDECLSRSDGRVDASTDEAGVFELERLQLGIYGLEAQKPQDGYCATFQDTTKVALTPTSPFAEVVFHLPPKCARLRGIVRNAKTGELLTDVSLRLRPTKGTDHCEVVTFDVQIPSQREFTLEVLAKGFETWAYSGTSDPNSAGKGPATPLTLRPGEQLDLNVRLTPLPDARTWAGIDCPIRDDHPQEEQ